MEVSKVEDVGRSDQRVEEIGTPLSVTQRPTNKKQTAKEGVRPTKKILALPFLGV
jgi:hypothetical protein